VKRDLVYPTVARNGDVVWMQSNREALFDLMWVSPDGRWERVAGGPIRGLDSPAVSPDGRKIAYSAVMDDNRDIWVLDLDRDTRRRLTSGPDNDQSPRWSPDGRWIYFVNWVPGKDTLSRVLAEGGAEPEHVIDASDVAPLPDGRTVIVANESGEGATMNLYRLDRDSGEMAPWLTTRFDERSPALSPDGRWIAYTSNESGLAEIQVRDVAGNGKTWLVSTNGGENPMWDPSGAVLYYRSDGVLTKVVVGSGATLSPGRPERVFPVDGDLFDADQPGFRIGFGVAPGPRFLVSRQSPEDPSMGILFERGWEPPVR
jgi:dipeptidyl aminopeptidase/acylaminoacyl peptidase